MVPSHHAVLFDDTAAGGNAVQRQNLPGGNGVAVVRIVAAGGVAEQIPGRYGQPSAGMQMFNFRKFLAAGEQTDFIVNPVDMNGIRTRLLFLQCADTRQGIIADMTDFIGGAVRIGQNQQVELPLMLDAASAVNGNDVFVMTD